VTDLSNLVPLQPPRSIEDQAQQAFVTRVVESLRRAPVDGIPMTRVMDPSIELDLLRPEAARPDGRVVELPPVEGWAVFTLRSSAESYRVPYVRRGRCEAGHEVEVVSSLPIGDARCAHRVPVRESRHHATEPCGAQIQP
jgi:hypothetical protein